MGVREEVQDLRSARSPTYPLFGFLRPRGVKIHDSHKPRLLIENLIAAVQQLIERGDLSCQHVVCEQSIFTHH